MARKTLYKTFYLEGGYSDYAFESALRDYAGRGSKAEWYCEWFPDGALTTNIPVAEIRAIARMVGRRMPDYTTSKDKPE